VPQVKKANLREAILASAFDLFCRKGYTSTTMSEIAKGAGTTVANLYVYFDSKLIILYEIYMPWLHSRLDDLKIATLKFRTPRTRLRRIFIGLWQDIPSADHAFSNTLIQALASAPPGMGKPTDSLAQVEGFVKSLIEECLPAVRAAAIPTDLLSHVIWMAFDGFVINNRLGDVRDIERIADTMTDFLLGDATAR
jgi:AcrR family transcriptional regulator